MIGETIVAMLCILALLIWILIMQIADMNRRISRLERLVGFIHGHGRDVEADEVTA